MAKTKNQTIYSSYDFFLLGSAVLIIITLPLLLYINFRRVLIDSSAAPTASGLITAQFNPQTSSLKPGDPANVSLTISPNSTNTPITLSGISLPVYYDYKGSTPPLTVSSGMAGVSFLPGNIDNKWFCNASEPAEKIAQRYTVLITCVRLGEDNAYTLNKSLILADIPFVVNSSSPASSIELKCDVENSKAASALGTDNILSSVLPTAKYTITSR